MPADTISLRRLSSLPNRRCRRMKLPIAPAKSSTLSITPWARRCSTPPAKPYRSIAASESAARRREVTNPRAINATAVAMSTSPMKRSRIISTSHLDVDDSLDDHRPREDEQSREDDHHLARQVGHEWMQVVGIQEREHEHEADRQCGHDPARHAALHRQRLDQPPQLEPLADRLRDAI